MTLMDNKVYHNIHSQETKIVQLLMDRLYESPWILYFLSSQLAYLL